MIHRLWVIIKTNYANPNFSGQTYFWKTHPDHFSKQGDEVRLDEFSKNWAGSRLENWNLEQMWISFPKMFGLSHLRKNRNFRTIFRWVLQDWVRHDANPGKLIQIFVQISVFWLIEWWIGLIYGKLIHANSMTTLMWILVCISFPKNINGTCSK